ncbi:MAG: cellulosome protein dockerin type I [Anaerolineae bacterium]|nr:cellulosome protein dockerin type I [Anaerolineae bacterium]
MIKPTPQRALWSLLIGVILLAGLAGTSLAQDDGTPVAHIDWTTQYQEIDGFGLSGAFKQADNLMALPEPQRTEILDLLFSQTEGAGFSIVRNLVGDSGTWGNEIDGPLPSIRPTEDSDYVWTGDEGQIWFMREAEQRGTTRFVSTVWSPPAWMKDNNSVIDGGSLLPDYYQAYADYLATYCNGYAEQHGIDIYAISLANEPDFSAGYSSALWSGDNFRDFVRDYLAPTFDALDVQCKVIVGETSGWKENIVRSALSDPAAAARIDIVAAHAYDGGIREFPLSYEMGKRIWQTEVSDFHPTDPTMKSGLRWAKMLHGHLTTGQANAWFYWWGMTYKDNEEALINMNLDDQTYLVNKRLWTLGNYARFVRPGWYRIEATAHPVPKVYVTAYHDPITGDFAIVVINDNEAETQFELALDGFSTAELVPYRTSATEDLAQLASIQVGEAAPLITLAPQSITTLVGTAIQ